MEVVRNCIAKVGKLIIVKTMDVTTKICASPVAADTTPAALEALGHSADGRGWVACWEEDGSQTTCQGQLLLPELAEALCVRGRGSSPTIFLKFRFDRFGRKGGDPIE